MPDREQTLEERAREDDADAARAHTDAASKDGARADAARAHAEEARTDGADAARAHADAARAHADAASEDGARDDDDEDDAREVEGDLDELVATAAQRDEYLALAQRTQADFENYRKRVARESAAAQRRGVAKLAKELLPALDNLDRALEEAGGSDPLLEGVRLVRSELGAALARVGIESFSPEGEQFDPAEHEAMAQQPVEGAERGTVVEVYQPGYRCDGTIIRPARVVVAA
jgi:molecular chaperone GrpE